MPGPGEVQVCWTPVRDARRHADAARTAVRRVIAQHTGFTARDLVFVRTAHGKPELGPGYASDLRFSVAYAGDFAVVALARNIELGVDIEAIDDRADLESLVRRFGSESERAAHIDLPVDVRAEAVFTWWTRKEAFVKATGLGLSFPLDAFDVVLDPRRPPAITAIRDDSVAAHPWTIVGLDAPAGYAGALVARAPQVRVFEHLIRPG